MYGKMMTKLFGRIAVEKEKGKNESLRFKNEKYCKGKNNLQLDQRTIILIFKLINVNIL